MICCVPLDQCPICLSEYKHPQTTKCGHIFCRECIEQSLKYSSFCPTCKTPLRTLRGNQPIGGQMNVQVHVHTVLVCVIIL